MLSRDCLKILFYLQINPSRVYNILLGDWLQFNILTLSFFILLTIFVNVRLIWHLFLYRRNLHLNLKKIVFNFIPYYFQFPKPLQPLSRSSFFYKSTLLMVLWNSDPLLSVPQWSTSVLSLIFTVCFLCKPFYGTKLLFLSIIWISILYNANRFLLL